MKDRTHGRECRGLVLINLEIDKHTNETQYMTSLVEALHVKSHGAYLFQYFNIGGGRVMHRFNLVLLTISLASSTYER